MNPNPWAGAENARIEHDPEYPAVLSWTTDNIPDQYQEWDQPMGDWHPATFELPEEPPEHDPVPPTGLQGHWEYQGLTPRWYAPLDPYRSPSGSYDEIQSCFHDSSDEPRLPWQWQHPKLRESLGN